ncbi:hypothetical protein O181_012962 [Austropuccinia psidii MF-1]|uniref:Uncharacterized protein n=1 Tax=Austropuccinia psidii MF-1 TaxID=1389203 RepID=A0A9Q3GNH7_9BASI|nr:hypothetical protein [Austropuccinia psidii MF-1]
MDHQILEAKYKSVLKKVRQVNDPMPQDLNPPVSRDHYGTPLNNTHLYFKKPSRSPMKDGKQLILAHQGGYKMKKYIYSKNVITLKEKEIAFCEGKRGLPKSSCGKLYKIPVMPHETWKKKQIHIPK